MAKKDDKKIKNENEKINKEEKNEEIPVETEKKPTYEELEDSIELLKTEIENSKKETEKYRNAAVSIKSDFENYKDYIEREKKDIERKTKEKVLKSVLTPYSKLSISMKYKETDEFVKAVEMVYRDFKKSFEDNGLEFIIPERGVQFDPFEHEVMDKVETDEVSEYHVYEVSYPGYKINGRVAEAAKVTVAVKPKKTEPVKDENVQPENNTEDKEEGEE
ncbi:MAG: nucleotide exchange factor GrpE [Thermotogae bacterium]|nr:nucleotide exchange factor GrpE [Thermotogota bacterium]